MTVSKQCRIGCLVNNVALGEDGKSYQSKQEMFLKNNGPEWTANRSKAIWNVSLLLRSGDKDSARKVLQANSIAYRKGTCIPKGIEGKVVKSFLQAQRPAAIKRVSSVLRFYTSIQLDQSTPKQLEKAIHSITGPYTGDGPDSSRWRHVGFSDIKDVISRRRKSSDITGYLDNIDSVSKRDASHLKGNVSYFGMIPIPPNVRGQPGASMAASLITQPWVPSDLYDLVQVREMRDLMYRQADEQGIDISSFPVGKISVIQEQGAKARVVTQPTAFCQLAFLPLNEKLKGVSEKLFRHESCLSDQGNGALTARYHLEAGGSVYSIDLSSATDRFPRSYSIGILEALGLNHYASALEEYCQQKLNASQLGREEIQYSVGQPMGLCGSFPLFHLSNLVVADKAVQHCISQGKNITSFPNGMYYQVVGDDIILSDPSVADRYSNLIRSMGIDVSHNKTLSGTTAEFAGFVIMKTNQGTACYRPYKVPPGDQITNGISFLDSLGVKVKSLNRWWARNFEDYRRTIGRRDITLSPYISEEVQFGKPSNRLDNQTMMNLSNVIAISHPHTLTFDLSGNPAINTTPLFQERGVFDHYGFNPDTYSESPSREKPYAQRVGLQQDPLLREVRKSREKEIDAYAALFDSIGEYPQEQPKQEKVKSESNHRSARSKGRSR